MNHARIAAELPPAMATWLEAAPEPVWDAIGREVCVRLGRDLLNLDGWHRAARSEFLATCTSPALQTVTPALPLRQWGAFTVARPLCAWFELFGAEDDVRRRLGEFPQSHIPRSA